MTNEFGIIKTGGKQYKVKAGEKLKIEKVITEDKKLEFTDLLFGKKVTAKVVEDGRSKKIRILKFHPKKHYKRVNGHRQAFTLIEIEKVG